jgi:F-type H+-transporting ATPase subunit b
MDTVTSIISSLGIDTTLFIQLGIFAVVFAFLKTVVFTPYFKAYEERQKKTQGNQQLADQLWAQTRELEAQYQRKARSLNTDVKAIFDKARLEATVEQEKIYSEARDKAKSTVDKAREVVQGELNRAREDLIKEAPELARGIKERLLSHEVRQ